MAVNRSIATAAWIAAVSDTRGRVNKEIRGRVVIDVLRIFPRGHRKQAGWGLEGVAITPNPGPKPALPHSWLYKGEPQKGWGGWGGPEKRLYGLATAVWGL